MEATIRNSSHLSQNEKDMNIGCVRALTGLASSQFFMYLFASLRSRHALSRLLNNWNDLEFKIFKFSHTGSTAKDARNKVFRHNALVCVALLAIIVAASTKAATTQAHPDFWLEVTINFTVRAYFVSMEMLHEMVVILTLKELCNNFGQVGSFATAALLTFVINFNTSPAEPKSCKVVSQAKLLNSRRRGPVERPDC